MNENATEAAEIRAKVKQIIHEVTSLDLDGIADNAHYKDDLGLDSLSILEIAVVVNYTFKLNLPENELPPVRTVKDTVELVQQILAKKAQAAV